MVLGEVKDVQIGFLLLGRCLGKGKDVYFAFLDLEKAYDKRCNAECFEITVYGIGGRLLRGVKNLYDGSKACVRVGNEVSEWFPAR